MEDDQAVLDARKKFQEKFTSAGRTGGKGTVRRTKKVVHKTTSTDDKRLTATLKRLGVNSIPGIEEVNIFKDDSSIIHFDNPKVQASIGANTYVVSGVAQVKSMADMLPSLLSTPAGLKQLQEMIGRGAGGGAGLESLLAGLQAGGAGLGAVGGGAGKDAGESMPDLEGDEMPDFEEVSKS